VYLPKGTWFNYWTGSQSRGEQTIRVDAPLQNVPLFVRGGAIIPLGPEMNWVGEKPSSPIRFEIYPDSRGAAATSLYEDDGISPEYQRGVFRRTAIRVTKVSNRYELTVSAPQGSYQPPQRAFEFRLNGVPRAVANFPDDGKLHRVALQ
jgi:alpha-glucosidase